MCRMMRIIEIWYNDFSTDLVSYLLSGPETDKCFNVAFPSALAT